MNRCSFLLVFFLGQIIVFIHAHHILNVHRHSNRRLSVAGGSNDCVTPLGEKGICCPLTDCPELVDIVNNRGGFRTAERISFLRSLICGFRGGVTQFCCASASAALPTTASPLSARIGKVPLPTMDECGVALVRRIVDGKEFKRGAHPWLAALGYLQEDGTFKVLCGGAVITKRHVITAAHCFVRQPGLRPITHVRLGEHSLSDNSERVQPITLQIMDRKNPGYDRISHVNDLELVVLEKEIQFTDYVRAACLPFGFEDTNFDNKVMTIVGWGHTSFGANTGTDVPLAANISVVPKDICRQDYISEPQVPLDKTQLCAGKGTTDSCQGDSGGPLLYHETRTYLLGVVSFGIGCGNENFPGVYAFVPEYLKWISDNV